MTAHVCGIDLGKTVFHLVDLSQEGHVVVKSCIATEGGGEADCLGSLR